MNGTAFKLGTFARSGGKPFVAIVLGDDVVELAAAGAASTHVGALTSAGSIDGLLQDWDANFARLQNVVADLEKKGLPGAVKLSSLRALPPVLRPGKMFYAAQNFQEHVDEMLRAGMTPASGPKFTGEKSTSEPYLFLKAPSTLAGANDDIAIPTGLKKIDWEAEIALAIGKSGKRIKAERALDHVAGFMTTNDVSARDLQIRADRPGLRSDWLNGQKPRQFRADGTVPGAARFRAGPQEFVHSALGQRRDQAERQYLAVHLHAGGADRICFSHSHARQRRYFQLRHLRRRRPGHQHISESRRCHGNRDRESRQNAQSLRCGTGLTYSSCSTFRSVGNSFIHNSATAMVPMPPMRAAGIAPSKAAVRPLSNSPS
jgi:2-keto-4-pentenoate hydratase/2-oxohepta-3-ene-1,7-dioic acid hydratase in catechol pathway